MSVWFVITQSGAGEGMYKIKTNNIYECIDEKLLNNKSKTWSDFIVSD